MLLFVILGGGLLWLFGRNAIHVGASGLVFGLIAFLIASGIYERRLVPMLKATPLRSTASTMAAASSRDGAMCFSA